MAKRQKTFHLDDDVIDAIEALKDNNEFGKGRSESYVTNEMLRESIVARSIHKAENAAIE